MYGGHVASLLKAHGIATVINLRGENPKSTWYSPERAVCTEMGIGYLDRPLHSRRLPKKQMLVELLDAYEAAPRPMLIKCSGGADRTALAAALYVLYRHGHEALPQARRQMALLPYLHLPKRHQRWIRRFPDYYEADGKGDGVNTWVGNNYQAAGFAAWLQARGLDDTWRK
jgi:protein tyrosine phosphatase (PTP) superfamily phosphohydrolase (DUF442 family)